MGEAVDHPRTAELVLADAKTSVFWPLESQTELLLFACYTCWVSPNATQMC